VLYKVHSRHNDQREKVNLIPTGKAQHHAGLQTVEKVFLTLFLGMWGRSHFKIQSGAEHTYWISVLSQKALTALFSIIE
jgi:hypothetical protein